MPDTTIIRIRPGESFRDFAIRATGKKEKTKGWNDEQRLALADPTGPHPLKLRHGPRVRIIAFDDLEKLKKVSDFTVPGWIFVARFEVGDAAEFPDGYPKLNLRPGNVNYLYLRFESGWFALIGECTDPSNPTTCQGYRFRVTQVERHDPNDPNSMEPPGTARWRWDDADEGVWVRCADGCCEFGAANRL